MAHQLDYFFDRHDAGSEALLSVMLLQLAESGLEAVLVGVKRGADWPEALDWVGGHLEVGGRPTGVHLEFHADHATVALSWDAVAGLPGAPSPVTVSGMCAVVLSGDVDWSVLEAVRITLKDRWGAAEHDETTGFAAG